MIFSKVAPADWQAYKELRLQALAENPQAFAVTIEEAESRTDEAWQELLQQPHICTLMVVEDGQPVGMVRAQWKPKNEKLRHIADIGSLFVANSQRGKGIGKQLMIKLEAVLKEQYEILKMKLFVMEDNPAAQLYEKMGYRQVGLLKREIGHEGVWYNEYLYEKWIG